MSKKKGTMTLKDFHGGSIPSDLPLPSAPGVTVRPTDGRGLDRQTPWGNPAGRLDPRLRPASAGSARNLDEKNPFLSHTSHIGRNFDEDERKPLGGVSGPRRMVCDDEIHSQASHSRELNSVSQSGAKIGNRPASVPTTQITSGSTGGSYAGRVSDLHNPRSSHQTSNYPIIGNKGAGMSGSHPNAWGIKKETVSTRDHVLTTTWSAPDAAVKLAHASALEKVSSGLWSSKQQDHPVKDAEVLTHRETEGELNYYANTSHNKKSYNRLDVPDISDPYDVSLAMHAGRSLVIDKDTHARGKWVPSYEQNITIASDGIQSHQLTEISGGAEFEVTSPLERPKLKLLPRSKPLENLGQSVDYNQDGKQIIDHHDVESKCFVQGPKSPEQSSLSLASDRAERPKLNLKPRSQPLEQEGNGDGKRTIFGQARPREVVLKERGIEEDASSYENQLPLRVKDGVPKAETFTNTAPVRYNDKSEFIPSEHGTTQYSDRRDYHVDGDKIDAQRRNRQNETRRNTRDGEKQRSQQHDRPPSPKTWRKPIEEVKPSSVEAPPLQYGKATSAVDLVQVFSKSVPSTSPVADRFSGPKGIPGRGNQVPFSRLVGPTPKPRVNGH